MVLVEATVSLSLITVIGLILLKMTLNILQPRQWVMQQTLSDAYLTYERAYAERATFDSLKASNSPWPQFPSTTVTQVEIGRLPGNRPMMGTVTRTRMPDTNNFPIAGGTGTATTNPAAIERWYLNSVLVYKVNGKSYAKARTVLRAQ